MHNNTMIFGAEVRRSEKWRVYRIRTANSTYELEVQSEGTERRCAVLTCVDAGPREGLSFEDSAPRIGPVPLYDVSAVEWIGQRLAVGTACTSEIVSVDFVKTTSGRAPRTRFEAPQPPKQEQPRPWSASPMGELEMLETAGSLLKIVCHAQNLSARFAHDPLLLKRYQLALAACGVMVEALEKRR